jgi:transposase
MSRYDLTDFEWRVIEPLLHNKPRGVPRVDDRRVLNGIFSKRLYRERNLIERFFSKLKHFRRVATHYDKLAANFLAMVQLASMRLWLRAYESTA